MKKITGFVILCFGIFSSVVMAPEKRTHSDFEPYHTAIKRARTEPLAYQETHHHSAPDESYADLDHDESPDYNYQESEIGKQCIHGDKQWMRDGRALYDALNKKNIALIAKSYLKAYQSYGKRISELEQTGADTYLMKSNLEALHKNLTERLEQIEEGHNYYSDWSEQL